MEIPSENSSSSNDYSWIPHGAAGSSQSTNYQTSTSHVHTSGPIYVNARQYARILKRRQARMLLESRKKMVDRRQYLHDSRHQHACKRPRGPSGRYLTREEIEKMRESELEETRGTSELSTSLDPEDQQNSAPQVTQEEGGLNSAEHENDGEQSPDKRQAMEEVSEQPQPQQKENS
jgi:hypothetical protein